MAAHAREGSMRRKNLVMFKKRRRKMFVRIRMYSEIRRFTTKYKKGTEY